MRRDLQQKSAPRDEDSDDPPEPSNLRFLRRLVTLLMATMIIGISVVAGALVYRISAGSGASAPGLTAEIVLEPGMRVVDTAFRTPDLIALVVRDGDGNERLRLYRLGKAGGEIELVEQDGGE